MIIQKFQTLKTQRNEEGFTLIELMIVVVIIGILAAIAIPIFFNQQRATIQAGMKSDVRNLQLVVATYLVKNPSATNLQWRYQDGVQAAGKALNSDTNWQQLVSGFTASHPDTIMIIRESRASNPEQVGTWDNYTVLAANTTASPNSGYAYFYYVSATGKYVLENG